MDSSDRSGDLEQLKVKGEEEKLKGKKTRFNGKGNLEQVALVLGLLIAVTLHEWGHARQALREGDPTAREMGRISFNPLRHLDPVGSILVPLLFILLPTNMIYGWAKPVLVNPKNYRDPVRGDIRVSLAGIAVNLAMAILFTLLLAAASRLMPGLGLSFGAQEFVLIFLSVSIFVNLILAFFNLIPVPPLDGSHVLAHILPAPIRRLYVGVGGKFGILLLLGLFFLWPEAAMRLFEPVQLAWLALAGWAMG